MTTKFCELPIGARFEFRGRRYEKLALSLARDEERCGNVFQDQTEVVPHPGALQLPMSDRQRWVAARAAHPGPHWTTHLCPAPAQPVSAACVPATQLETLSIMTRPRSP